MAKSSHLIRHYNAVSPRRYASTSVPRRTSVSPPRSSVPLAARALSPRPFTDLPGPLALPMLRHSAHVLPRIGSFHQCVGLGLLEGLRGRYGDLVRLARGSRTRPVLYVFDPDHMREVYESGVTEPPRWDKSPSAQQRSKTSKCPMNGDESKAIWAAVRALLLDSSLLNHYDKVFDDIALDFTRRLEGLRHQENTLNEEVLTELYRWALESLGQVVLGTRVGCLDGDPHVTVPGDQKPQKTSMDDHIEERCSLVKRSAEGLTLPERLVRSSLLIADQNYLVRSDDTLKTQSEVFQTALTTLDEHFSIIQQYLDKSVESRDQSSDQSGALFLDKMRPLKHKLLPVAADMILAGTEPLAQSALSLFFQLSVHAAQQQRAHDAVSCRAAAAAAGARCPGTPYVDACVRELLRLVPPTGGVVRRSREDLVVGGYEIPAGVDIVLAHGVTSRCEQWGRPHAFVPDRWCPEVWQSLKASRAHPLSSLPFGEACPAEGIVGRMLSSLAARVLEKYRLEWHGPSPNTVTTGVNKLQPPFYFVLQNAS